MGEKRDKKREICASSGPSEVEVDIVSKNKQQKRLKDYQADKPQLVNILMQMSCYSGKDLSFRCANDYD